MSASDSNNKNSLQDEHLHALIAKGNHEAYERLKKRYRLHTFTLCNDIINRYSNSGLLLHDLVAICYSVFPFVIKQFDPMYSSFFSFWKEATTHEVMDYVTDNSYLLNGSMFKGFMSVDDIYEDGHPYADYLCEMDEDRECARKVREIKTILTKYDNAFERQELALLNLVLEGYSLSELEHGEVMSKSNLYLTFKTAIEKLRKIMNRVKTNKR